MSAANRAIFAAEMLPLLGRTHINRYLAETNTPYSLYRLARQLLAAEGLA